MLDASLPPLVGLAACVKAVVGEGLKFHATPEPYVLAVAEGAGALPVLLPALDRHDPHTILARLDGLVLPGSKSNVAPDLYGLTAAASCPPHDPQRDAATLPLIRAAIEMGVPLLAICRGIQELNVALGGSLHPRVHEVPGKADHRPDRDKPLAERFGLAHPVQLAPGGLLARLAGAGTVQVNSLHGQGIDRLAPGLTVEATAPDGLVEAVRVEGARSFAVGVQWHPEWNFRDNPLSAALLQAFGAAARERAIARHAFCA